eukprot:6234281-Pyramimonas_sp.AAC.1
MHLEMRVHVHANLPSTACTLRYVLSQRPSRRPRTALGIAAIGSSPSSDSSSAQLAGRDPRSNCTGARSRASSVNGRGASRGWGAWGGRHGGRAS